MARRTIWSDLSRLDLHKVGESVGKTNKQLIEDWGLETDEENGITMKQFPVLPARVGR